MSARYVWLVGCRGTDDDNEVMGIFGTQQRALIFAAQEARDYADGDNVVSVEVAEFSTQYVLDESGVLFSVSRRLVQ